MYKPTKVILAEWAKDFTNPWACSYLNMQYQLAMGNISWLKSLVWC